MKRNTKIALVMMALSAMAMGSTSAFAHGGHGMWQQNAAPLTSEQQTAWQKIHNDFYAQSSALQQQLVTKRYEYNALLAANPPDSSKINAVAKEMENLRQSLDELRYRNGVRRLRWWRSYGYGPLVNQNVFSLGCQRQKSEFATNSNCEPSGASSHATLTSTEERLWRRSICAIACESKSGLMVCPSQVVTVCSIACQRPWRSPPLP